MVSKNNEYMYVYLRLNNIWSSTFRIIFITYHDALVIAQYSEDIFSSLAYGLVTFCSLLHLTATKITVKCNVLHFAALHSMGWPAHDQNEEIWSSLCVYRP